MDHKPILSEVLTFPQLEIFPQLSSDSYHFLRFDLFPGSTVLTKWDFEKYNVIPHFMIIRTSLSFESWKNGNGVFGNIMHHQQGAKGKYAFTAPVQEYTGGSSQYYFIFFTESFRQFASGRATFDVTAQTYSVSDALAVCPNPTAAKDVDAKEACSFTLNEGQQRYIVLTTPVGLGSYTVIYTTIARSTILGAIYSHLPVIFLVLLVSSCMVCCGCLDGLFDIIAKKIKPESDYMAIVDEFDPHARSSGPDYAPSAPPTDPPYNPEFASGSHQTDYHSAPVPPPYSETDQLQYKRQDDSLIYS
jgi:hypothetical protein